MTIGHGAADHDGDAGHGKQTGWERWLASVGRVVIVPGSALP